MQTNQQFDLAFNLLQNTGTNLFLTGKAGTGKTTFLKRLKEVSPKPVSYTHLPDIGG